MEDEIKNFTVAFFANLKCALSWKGENKEILNVQNIPESFEKFYGKRGPYNLTFKIETKNLFPDTELINSSSFLISCMRELLENKGQTTLLKINFELDPKLELKKNFLFKNCDITSITKKETPKTIIRFTFQTVFQYLNEKEQVMHEIYLEDGKIISFDLKNFKTLEGKKETIAIGDIKKEYSIARDQIHSILEPQIMKISSMLDLRLEKELTRIKLHFSNQKNELELKEKELKKDLEELNTIQEKDNSTLAKIQKIEQALLEIKNINQKEKLEREESFFIKDETQKHALSLNTKLINTTIIYYPLFSFSGFLRSPVSTRIIEITYHPILKEFSKLYCDCCKKEINKISLCSSGHLSCEHCLRGCSDCGKDFCNLCLTHACFTCGKKVCKKCAKRCSKCHKDKCSSHMASSNVCQTCEENNQRTNSRIRLFK
jgi:hypothetical protein